MCVRAPDRPSNVGPKTKFGFGCYPCSSGATRAPREDNKKRQNKRVTVQNMARKSGHTRRRPEKAGNTSEESQNMAENSLEERLKKRKNTPEEGQTKREHHRREQKQNEILVPSPSSALPWATKLHKQGVFWTQKGFFSSFFFFEKGPVMDMLQSLWSSLAKK